MLLDLVVIVTVVVVSGAVKVSMFPAVMVTREAVAIDVAAVVLVVTVTVFVEVIVLAGKLALQYDWADALVEHLATYEYGAEEQ